MLSVEATLNTQTCHTIRIPEHCLHPHVVLILHSTSSLAMASFQLEDSPMGNIFQEVLVLCCPCSVTLPLPFSTTSVLCI
jgi:hypothetical protein